MTEYLSLEDLHAIAEVVIFGSDRAVVVLDWGLLASAAARPQASAFGEDAYPGM